MPTKTQLKKTSACFSTNHNQFLFGLSNGSLLTASGSEIGTKAKFITHIGALASRVIVIGCSSDGLVVAVDVGKAKTVSSALIPSQLPISALFIGGKEEDIFVGDVGGTVTRLRLNPASLLTVEDRYQVSPDVYSRAVTAISEGFFGSGKDDVLVATAAASSIHFIHNSKTEFLLSVPGVVTSLFANETKSIIYATTSTSLLAIQAADSVPVTVSSPPRVTCIQSFSSVITSCIILSSVNGFSSGHHLLVSCQDCAIYLVSFETPTTTATSNNSDNSPQHPPPSAQPPSPPPIRQIQTRVVVPASEFGSCAWVSSMCLNREPEKPVIVAAATEGMAKFLKLAVVCSDGTLTAFDVVRGGGGGGGDSGDVSGYHDSIQLVAIRKNELKRAGSSGSSGGVGGGDDGEKRRAHALDSVLRVARGDDDVFMWKEGGGNGGGGGETGGESVAKRSRVVQGDGMEDVKIDHVVAAVSSGETGTPMVGVQQGGKPVVTADEDEEDGEIVE